jgi:glyoxylase-like metal-dependent hydrolase (beta-lactamase superfamily II)
MMTRTVLRRATAALLMAGLLALQATAVAANSATALPFDAAALVKVGDNVKFGSYVVYKVGDGIYKINDPGVTTGKGGAWGVDIYLVRGKSGVLVIDLGNNYMLGYAQDVIAPRPNAAEEFRAIVFGLAGRLPVDAAITHAHPDHDGMTGAFLNIARKVTVWMPEGEDFNAPKAQYGLDPGVFTRFPPGKEFDLGGGRVVKALPVRGHSGGSSVYLLTPDMYLFTGDSIGSGFGQAFPTIDRLRQFAQDSHQLVEYISSRFPPYERYALKVFTGHSWQNSYGGWWSPKHAKVDVGYLDWRFVQDVSSAANGILKGEWLTPGSGLQYVGKMEYTDAWPSAGGRAIMVYGTGTIIIPLETAYEAADLKMPPQ